MDFPFDVLDSIFGFLKSHPDSLVASSKAHPILSQAIERHLYYHVRFRTCSESSPHGIAGYTLEPSHLIKLLTKTPHLVNYIRILQIDFRDFISLNQETSQILQHITSVLPMFSMLECMILVAPSDFISWKQLPLAFRTAVENCLRLSTLQRLHVGELDFPLSILEKNVNINCFSLSGYPKIPDCSDDTNLQLTALSFDGINFTPPFTNFTTWAKRHITNLQSLKCNYSDEKIILELLEVCSDTLNRLDLLLELPCELSSCFS